MARIKPVSSSQAGLYARIVLHFTRRAIAKLTGQETKRMVEPLEIDQSIYEMAQRLAETGADVARHGGLEAEALAVVEQGTVAGTLLRLARERHARAIVSTHGRRYPLHEPTGSTAQAVLESAPCPAVVVRYPEDNTLASE